MMQHHIVLASAVASPCYKPGYCGQTSPCSHEILFVKRLETLNKVFDEFAIITERVHFVDISEICVRNQVSHIAKRSCYKSGDIHLNSIASQQVSAKLALFFSQNYQKLFD